MNANSGGTIRAFTEGDYQALVDLRNAVRPQRSTDVATCRRADRERDPRSRCGRWLYEEQGHVLGVAGYRQDRPLERPREFSLYLEVVPEARGRGIGSRLYRWLESALALYAPEDLVVAMAADLPALGFLTARGYRKRAPERGDEIVMVKKGGESLAATGN